MAKTVLPTKYNEEVSKALVKHVSDGLSFNSTCGLILDLPILNLLLTLHDAN
ncbi:hypothetical protein KKC44_00800 [Patescibacteria group bacterium]|nr:hypothetical protein [Patescibacteria group bacterium]MBU2259122.1 hypothetical protein [Patescibacteria group bacterium]